MTSTDIRDNYDFSGKERQNAASCLDVYPPLWLRSWSSSGLDCLIVVLRRIYSYNLLEPGIMGRLGWYQQSEARNPILGHAWHVFGNSPDEIQRTTADRKRVDDALRSLGVDPTASFESLCTSSLMTETFWAHGVFSLTHPPFSAETGLPIPLSADEMVKISTLELNSTQPAGTLQHVANQAFGVRRWGEGQMVLRPHKPWVIRVVYSVDNNSSNPSIQDLKTLTLPDWQKHPDKPTLTFQEVGRVKYYLMAVVRMRQGSGRDLVRTYNPTGSNVLFHGHNANAIMDKGWSIKDGKRKYILFYRFIPANVDLGLTDPTWFPEVAEPEEVAEDWIADFEAAIERAKATLPSTVSRSE
ncbi:hypothetical protein ACHAP4_009912 [Fusarium culmorum]